MGAIQFIRQWHDRRKKEIAAKAIYFLLVDQYQRSGRPGAGVEVQKDATTADFVRYLRRKYPMVETTITGSCLVVSLKAGFDAVTSSSLREHLERSGYLGQQAIENYANAAAAAEELGKVIGADAKLVHAEAPIADISTGALDTKPVETPPAVVPALDVDSGAAVPDTAMAPEE